MKTEIPGLLGIELTLQYSEMQMSTREVARVPRLPSSHNFSQIILHTDQVHGRAPGRMGLHEELAGGLPKVPDLALDGLAHDAVRHRLQVHAALVRQVVEHVGRAHSLGTCAGKRKLVIGELATFLICG